MSRSVPILFVAVVVLAACAVGCAGPAESGNRSGTRASGAAVRDAALPVRLCLPLDADTVAALSRGDTRLALDLRNRRPSDRYSAPFVLSLLQPDGSRWQAHSFGMQPDVRDGAHAAPQRFLVDLREARWAPNARGEVCFELAREAEADADATPQAASRMDVALGWRSVVAPAP